MALTRRMFAQFVASALLLRHLPALAQTPLTVAIGGTPGPNITQRVVSAGAPADMLLLAVAPEKLVGLSSFDFSRQTAIPFHDDIRALPKLGRLAGRASTLSLETLLALKPDLVVDCGNADETWLSQARQVSAQTQIPWLLINGELRRSPEQLLAAGEALGVDSRARAQVRLARRFVDEALAFSHSPGAKLSFYAARGARGLETGLQGSLHTEAAELLGLHNVAQIPGRQGLTQVSMENLLSWQPDIILVQDAVTAQYLREDPVWQGVNAVANQRILFLSGLPFGWLDAPPGINRLLGLRRLHAWLDPQVNASFKADMQRYSELFWHTTLSDAQYQRLVAV
ncbi:TPA: ABC transporter substrate-binding protein [Salmonella enterica]|uniref:ABC transporter ATP-binding protein n=1 Tax=Salmonella enterica I TaxID=59201 RepID=A0A7Z1Q7A2_SALET|nr:ABC transporter substrate-binding protein [Salmonella enterica]EGC1289971.1 ABC transporter substrate-binding protein [Salmonella enterica]PUF26046.1 ABC transporter ATP-binding protein [Salmonella enterica subsp. enterica]PUF50101.1 ABC transporter ATP-binding protein [Salmonella enterica subsp. enterica]HCA3884004.1 ABC transporter substrate-binding protein [Salmonella enterica]